MSDHARRGLADRVHGVADVYSTRKPSFDALRKQASPVESLAIKRAGDAFELEIATREQLPAYTLRGYVARWLFYGYDDLPMDGRIDRLPDLKAGTNLSLSASSAAPGLKRVAVEILRPTGFSAASAELVL